MRADRFWKKTGKKITIQGSDDWSYMANEKENHALVADDEVLIEFALMAKSSSSSDNKVYDDSYCSKSCRKNIKNLNTKISKLNEELSDCETDLYNYKRGLSQVEARLVEFKENEVKFYERIRVLERDVEIRDNKIEYLKNELEQVKKEKERLDNKLIGFGNALKDLDDLLGSQRPDKNKEGLRYSAVPPPHAQIYSPPKKDLSWTCLPEFVDDTVTDYRRPTPSIDALKCNKMNSKVVIFLFLSMENQQEIREKLLRPQLVGFGDLNKILLNKGNPHNNIDDKGYWDSGCSRHMNGNISYLSEYKPYDGGYVSFRHGGGKITGKGIIKTVVVDKFFGYKIRCWIMDDNIADFLTTPFDVGRFQYLVGEGLANPTEPHHTPSPQVHQSPHSDYSPQHDSPPLSHQTIIPEPILHDLQAPTETLTPRRLTKRDIRIAQSKALLPDADEPASLLRDDRHGEAFPTVSSLDAGQDMENIVKTSAMSHESSPRVLSLDADDGSMQQRLHELMELCTSLQRQQSQMADKIKNHDIEISRLKARVKSLEDKKKTLSKQAARGYEIGRIHTEEELKLTIEGLDRSNEVIAKHLTEYEQTEADLSVGEKIELISELVKYQDHLAAILKYQAQQSKPSSKKEQRKFYMSVLKSHAGWKTEHFRGMTLEQIKEKFESLLGLILYKTPWPIKGVLRTELKIREMNQFCKMKGGLRQFSIARAPQQNRVVQRRNRKLIEAARTMLSDSKLPTTFWAEAVNNACYVQNSVLVVKPHNKTPYELFHGRTPTFSFLRPFRCPVTILNTIDHLGKFDGKADEGFFVRYSFNCKAFRVFNSKTRIVEDNLHIRFSESTPNVIDPKSSNDNGSKPSSDDGKKVDEDPRKENYYNKIPFDPNMPTLEDVSIFNFSSDDEDDGTVADKNNLDTAIQIKEEVYVCQPPGFKDLDFPDRVYKVEKAIYQVNLKVSHLHAVKRIFRYLKGQQKRGLWFLKDSPFDLVAYTDSDYAGASLDRESTTGGYAKKSVRLMMEKLFRMELELMLVTQS
nr:retrovirus-related Pol polyprotein from transposon TNT 1-94 [Tanacetum cinerariifolium]